MFRVMEWFNGNNPEVPKDTKGIKYAMATKNGVIYVRFSIWRKAVKAVCKKAVLNISCGEVFDKKELRLAGFEQSSSCLFAKFEGAGNFSGFSELDFLELEGFEVEFVDCSFILPKGQFLKSGY